MHLGALRQGALLSIIGSECRLGCWTYRVHVEPRKTQSTLLHPPAPTCAYLPPQGAAESQLQATSALQQQLAASQGRASRLSAQLADAERRAAQAVEQMATAEDRRWVAGPAGPARCLAFLHFSRDYCCCAALLSMSHDRCMVAGH